MKALLSVAKKLLIVATILILIVAFFVCLSWVVSPVLHKHRADVETWLGKMLGLPVTIQKVDLSWYHYQPVVSLNSVILQNKETHQPVLQIKKVLVFFSIPKSIRYLKPMPNGILVSGAELDVNQSAKGGITIQGFPNLGGYNAAPYKQESDLKDMLGWLALQPKIILENIDIHFKGLTGSKRFITLYDLSLTNSQADHVILGKAILHQTISTEVTVALRWLGSDLDLSKIKAKLYLYVSGLSLDQWLRGSKWNGWEVKHGVLSTKIWANWHLGKFRKIQAILQIYSLSLFSELNKKTHYIDRISGHLGWKENQKTQAQEIAGDDILIDFASHLWPVTRFFVSLQPDVNGKLLPEKINLGYLNLKDAQKILFSSANTFFSDAIYASIMKLNLSGDIEKMSLIFSKSIDWQTTSLATQFKRISFSAYQNYPGIKNLTGHLQWDGKKGNLIIASHRIELEYHSLYSHALFLDELSAEIEFAKKESQEKITPALSTPFENQTVTANRQGWEIKIPQLKLINTDLTASLKGSLSIPQDKNVYADLSAELAIQQANRINHYLPVKIMDAALVKWLKKAFLLGSIKSANAILKGNLKDFPFDQGGGDFSVSGKIENVNLHYADDWPMLEKIDGVLTFKGKEMLIAGDHAEISGIPLYHINARIDDLTTSKSSILYVKSDPIQTDFTQALNFVDETPLKKTLGKMFSGMKIKGPTTLNLVLTVPLKDPDKTAVIGELDLKNTELNLVPWHLMLQNINGLLHFTENTTVANHIQAVLFHKPITFDLLTVPLTKDTSIIQAISTLSLSVKDLEDWLHIPISKVATGETMVEVKIDLSLQRPLEITLDSKLLGLNLNLNNQFSKAQDEIRPLSVNIMAEEAQPLRIKLKYSNELSAALLLKNDNNQFAILSANLNIGRGEATFQKENGLLITGNFSNLNWEKIQSYLNQSSNSDNLPKLPFRGIEINIENLSLAKLEMLDLNIKAIPDNNEWEIEVSSPDIVGKISLPNHFSGQGNITARFEKLHLHNNDDKSIHPSFDTKNLPAITFIATNTSYNNTNFGAITFKTAFNETGQTIETLRIFSKFMDLQAKGNWFQTKINKTKLRGTVVSKRVDDLLTSLGLDVHNYVLGNGKANFNLTWDEVPFSPNLASLNGNLRLQLGEGRIVEVGQASSAKLDIGRMLSILSLQSIPRRLSLNFSDLFQKGYSFDKVEGDFIFRDGNAYTSNLHFEGPIARVGINGRIGLITKDYDLIISVTPYVTSTLPLVATLITAQPLIGLAALAVNSVIEVSRAATYYYAVKGPWSNPTWNSVHG